MTTRQVYDAGNGNVGIGNQVTPLANHVISNPPPPHTTGRAALIVDQFENQDIFPLPHRQHPYGFENDGDLRAQRFMINQTRPIT